jgi:hypothetical protein
MTTYLGEVNDATTQQIFQHVNANTKHGAVMNQLANILAKAPEFMKIGTERHDGFTGTTNTVCRWALSGKTKPEEPPE